jgi:hypothetical protein
MEAAAVSTQQAILQTALSQSMVKQQAQTEQALVSMIQKSIGPRGQNLDLSV